MGTLMLCMMQLLLLIVSSDPTLPVMGPVTARRKGKAIPLDVMLGTLTTVNIVQGVA